MKKVSDKKLEQVYAKTVGNAKKQNKWIQKIAMKKGALREELDTPNEKNIPTKKLAIKKTDTSRIKKMKSLAKTLKKF